MTSALLLVLISVTQHVIAMAARNQPNSVESQRPLKFVSKTLLFCSFTGCDGCHFAEQDISLASFPGIQSQLTQWKAW